jgi:hypothetical protein
VDLRMIFYVIPLKRGIAVLLINLLNIGVARFLIFHPDRLCNGLKNNYTAEMQYQRLVKV